MNTTQEQTTATFRTTRRADFVTADGHRHVVKFHGPQHIGQAHYDADGRRISGVTIPYCSTDEALDGGSQVIMLAYRGLC
jgi:hypothetical protein